MRAPLIAATAIAALLAGACASPTLPPRAAAANLPVLQGWYEGKAVFYITTDVSDAAVAKEKGANFAPRLAYALPLAGTQAATGRSAVDKVYAVTNFAQPAVFASAPNPIGPLSRDAAYSPLWQMVKVTWSGSASAYVLKSEEAVLDAQEKGLVTLQTTPVVLNCPIIDSN
jgi:hypothetical protein